MQSIEEAIGPILTVLFIAALLAERFFAHHTMPERRWWRSIGAVFLVITAVINIGTPLLLPIDWIAAHSLPPGYKLGVAGGFVLGWVVYSFFYYLWHRFQRRTALVWRLMH